MPATQERYIVVLPCCRCSAPVVCVEVRAEPIVCVECQVEVLWERVSEA
jgi:hypothetical protein